MPRLVIDTDVLIDYLRGDQRAIDYLEPRTEPLSMSVVTMAELYAGVREGLERESLDILVQVFGVIPVDRRIAFKGGLFRREYRKSHALALPDALIAATADIYRATLVTLNEKHFPMLTDVIVPYRKA